MRNLIANTCLSWIAVIGLLSACADKEPTNLDECLQAAMKKDSAKAIAYAVKICQKLFPEEAQVDEEKPKPLGPQLTGTKYVKGTDARCHGETIDQKLKLTDGLVCAKGGQVEEVSPGTYTLTCYDASNSAQVYNLTMDETRIIATPRTSGDGALVLYHHLSSCESSISDADREAYQEALAEQEQEKAVSKQRLDEERKRKLKDAIANCCTCLGQSKDGLIGMQRTCLPDGIEDCLRRLNRGDKARTSFSNCEHEQCGASCSGTPMGR